jgi:phospholipase/carboxylesterase
LGVVIVRSRLIGAMIVPSVRTGKDDGPDPSGPARNAGLSCSEEPEACMTRTRHRNDNGFVPTRRRFLIAAAQLAQAGLLAGCVAWQGQPDGSGNSASLAARLPETLPSRSLLGPGRHRLGLERERDSLLYIPPAPYPEDRASFLVTLHGAGGDAAGGLSLLVPLADEYGLVLLAPASRESTWDAVLRGRYGPDVAVINRALDKVFRTVPVNRERIGIAGFSDGASYALGLGLANGGIFRRIIAFSPGFVPPAPRLGRPAVFISHGEDDAVLPIGSTSRRIVPALRRDGYDVDYVEFPGRHTVPHGVAEKAAEWLGWDPAG